VPWDPWIPRVFTIVSRGMPFAVIMVFIISMVLEEFLKSSESTEFNHWCDKQNQKSKLKILLLYNSLVNRISEVILTRTLSI
jgi:hypothetical protein